MSMIGFPNAPISFLLSALVQSLMEQIQPLLLGLVVPVPAFELRRADRDRFAAHLL